MVEAVPVASGPYKDTPGIRVFIKKADLKVKVVHEIP